MAQYYEAVGRRKESTARVRLMDGSGTFTVNDKEAPVYFPRIGDLQDILRAFKAVRLGVARALVLINGDWTSPLRKNGLLTRNPRVKERKKPGLKKARKAPTYTKR